MYMLINESPISNTLYIFASHVGPHPKFSEKLTNKNLLVVNPGIGHLSIEAMIDTIGSGRDGVM